MRRWWLLLALLLSTGVNLGVLGVLLLHRPRPLPAEDLEPPRLQLGVQRLVDHLGLEGEERERFLTYQRQFLEATRGGRLQMAELHRALRQELARPEPDRAEIDRLLAESRETFATMERSMTEAVLGSRQLLDPQQDRAYLRFLERVVPAPGAGRAPRGPALAPGRRPLRRPGGRERPMVDSPANRR